MPETVITINHIQAAMLNGEYKKAYSLVNGLCPNDSTDPTRYIFRAAVLQAEMIDTEENFAGEELKQLCDSTLLLSEDRLSNCNTADSALYYLYMGHQYAYRALWEIRFGSKLSALKNGFKARGRYQEGLDIDSTLYDLYLGLGSFHYWKSVKSGILRSIGIFRDEREKGVREVQLAADSSFFSRDAARSALIWIKLNEEDYDAAIELAQTMFQEFPGGNSLLWPMAEAYYKKELYGDAAKIYRLILNRQINSPGNYFNIIESSYRLCHSLEETGRADQIYKIAEYIKSIQDKIPDSTKKRQKGNLKYLLKR